MLIEMLDYGITIDSHETVNYFRNFPNRGSIGYFSFEDAEADRNPLGNIEKYLDIVEDFISAGLIGDHYVFTNGQVSEIISEYEEWDWTPETGIIPWESEVEPEPEVCLNRKQRRSARRVQNARHKRADRLHGKGTYVYRYKEGGQIKEVVSGNEYRNWATWVRTMHSWGDPEGKKRRLPRMQSVNIHFTDGCRPDVADMTEADVVQMWSVSSHDLPMGDFFQYMDNMDWKRIPSEVRFSVDWNTENPFTCGYPEPEYFEMTAALRRSQKTLSAEKAKQEYLKFKKEYQIFQKYGEKLRTLREEMYAELD